MIRYDQHVKQWVLHGSSVKIMLGHELSNALSAPEIGGTSHTRKGSEMLIEGS